MHNALTTPIFRISLLWGVNGIVIHVTFLILNLLACIQCRMQMQLGCDGVVHIF